jgi:hypothetical protein
MDLGISRVEAARLQTLAQACRQRVERCFRSPHAEAVPATVAKDLAGIPTGLGALARPSGLPQITTAVQPHLATAAALAAQDPGGGERVMAAARTWEALAGNVVGMLDQACGAVPVGNDPSTPAGVLLCDLAAAKDHLDRAWNESLASNPRRAEDGLEAARHALDRARAAAAAVTADLDRRQQAQQPVSGKQPSSTAHYRVRQAAERLAFAAKSVENMADQAGKAAEDHSKDPLLRNALSSLRGQAMSAIAAAKTMAQALGPGNGTPGASVPMAPRATSQPTNTTAETAAPGTGDWARLSAQAQETLRSGGAERFPPDQQAAINAYLQRLGAAR